MLVCHEDKICACLFFLSSRDKNHTHNNKIFNDWSFYIKIMLHLITQQTHEQTY